MTSSAAGPAECAGCAASSLHSVGCVIAGWTTIKIMYIELEEIRKTVMIIKAHTALIGVIVTINTAMLYCLFQYIVDKNKTEKEKQ